MSNTNGSDDDRRRKETFFYTVGSHDVPEGRSLEHIPVSHEEPAKEIYSHVFDHHRLREASEAYLIPDLGSANSEPVEESGKRIEGKDAPYVHILKWLQNMNSYNYIDYVFYKKFYKLPKLSRSIERDEKAEVSFEFFLKDLLPGYGTSESEPSNSPTQPSDDHPERSRSRSTQAQTMDTECQLRLLVGRTGAGKTAFYSYLLANTDDLIKNGYFPIYVEIEEIFEKQVLKSIKQAGDGYGDTHVAIDICTELLLSETCFQIINQLPNMYNIVRPSAEFRERAELLAGYRTNPMRSTLSHVGFITDLSKYLAELDLKMLLLMDNSDAFYYRMERARFIEGGDIQSEIVLTSLDRFLAYFYSGPLKDLPISVLFSMRKYVHYEMSQIPQALVNRPDGIYAPNGRNNYVYRIDPVEPERVVNSRVLLLEWMIDQVSDQSVPENWRFVLNRLNIGVSVFYRALQTLDKVEDDDGEGSLLVSDFRANTSMLDTIARLADHGNKGVISHLQRFYNGKDNKVTRRWLKASSNSVIAYITDMWTRYAQGETGFPNVFLVRNEANVTNPYATAVPKKARFRHSQTYWLKYAILSFVKQNQYKVDKDQVLNYFTGKDGEFEPNEHQINGYYSPTLVKLVLGVLSTVEGHNLIHANNANDRKFELTTRGEAVLDDLLSHFSYFQLIIEDSALEIPFFLHKLLKPARPKFGYDYLTYEDQDDYVNSMVELVDEKFRQVSVFLDILEVSLKYEKKRFPGVYNKHASIDPYAELGWESEDDTGAEAIQAPVRFAMEFPFTDVRQKIFLQYSGLAVWAKSLSNWKGDAYDQSKIDDFVAESEPRKEKLKEFFQKTYLDLDV